MDRGRFLVDAVVLGGASPTQLARSHPISESWLFRLLARYRAGGYPALEPRSRRPKSSPRQTSPETLRPRPTGSKWAPLHRSTGPPGCPLSYVPDPSKPAHEKPLPEQ